MTSLQWIAKSLTVQVGVLHGPGCILPSTMRCTKSRRQGVFSDRRCTHETAVAAPELTPSCSVKSIDDRRIMYFVRRRMMSSIYENGRPIKVSYATRCPRGRSDVSMEKTDLSGRLETTQEWQAKASDDLTLHHRAAGEQDHCSRHPRSERPFRSLPALAVVHQRPPPQLGDPLPCWVFEPVF